MLPSGFVAGIKNSRSPFDFAQGRLSTSLAPVGMTIHIWIRMRVSKEIVIRI